MSYTRLSLGLSILWGHHSKERVPKRISMGLIMTVFAVLRNIFVLGCIIIVCSLLFPVLWHLWIYAGSANSNFFYAITLTFNVGQVRVKGSMGTGIPFIASDIPPRA